VTPRWSGGAVTACLVVAVLSGCGRSHPHPVAPEAAPTTTPTGNATPAATLTDDQIADPGLPSTIGPGGKLSKIQVIELMQYFEDKVNDAYAQGRAEDLAHYLAGPQLNGNRATVLLLNAQHRRNVVKIQVTDVTIQANETNKLVFDLAADMTADYFVDTSTTPNTVLNNGLPGPSRLQFLVFLDYNPNNHTWYWTGEQAQTGRTRPAGAG
jgi:hypothetical protein